MSLTVNGLASEPERSRRRSALPPHHQSHIRRIPITDIRVDSDYQRDVDTTRVNKMLRSFDARRLGVVAVSARGGKLWMVDGQHRLRLLEEHGDSYVDAVVYEGLTKAEEAGLFVLLNRGSKSVNAWDLFKAQRVEGDPDVLTIVGVVERAGFRIDRASAHDNIGAVGALRRVFNLGGEGLLALTLNTVRSIWTADREGRAGQVIEGLALFFHSFRGTPQYDDERAKRILRNNSPTTFIRAAQEIAARRRTVSSSATYVGEAIRDIYNQRLSRPNQLGDIRRFKKTYSRKP